jgi:hypothetical protein
LEKNSGWTPELSGRSGKGTCLLLLPRVNNKKLNKFRGLSPRTKYMDRRLSAKLVAAFADRGVSRSQRDRSPAAVIQFSRPEPLLFLSDLILGVCILLLV